MHPKQLHKRVVSDAKASHHLSAIGTNDFSKTSLRNEAALLLSIADIAQSELTTCPSALSDHHDFETSPTLRFLPKFPSLSCSSAKYDPKSTMSPQTDSLRGLLYGANTLMGTGSSRIRSVSIEDSPTGQDRRTPSPLACPPTLGSPALVTPTPKSKPSIRCARLSIKARHELVASKSNKSVVAEKEPITPTTPGKSKPLQGPIPKGVSITKVYRKKFSWKSYPEVSSKPSYSRHSIFHD